MRLTVRPLEAHELRSLTALFRYNDVPAMIGHNAALLEAGSDSIYLLFADDTLVGELHVSWFGDDSDKAVAGQRAYLYALRIRDEWQGRGLGQHLLKEVLQTIADRGCREVSIGVESDNAPARHIYAKLGFTEWIARKEESYQGDSYGYDLYLKRL